MNYFFSKKIIFFVFVFLVTSLLISGFFVWQAKKQKRMLIQNAKAPEITLTIVEGWNLEEIANYLEQKNITKKTSFFETLKTIDLSKYPILKTKPKNSNLEGFLFPDTYRIFDPEKQKNFTYNPNLDLLEKMLQNFQQKFTVEMQAQAKKNQMTVYDTLVLASIIEKETGRNAVTENQKTNLDQERKIVSGIFLNRLKNNIPLESDATINYITKKNNPTPTNSDLNTNSPYNTYKNKGLPPSPICNPSLSSILAALYPETTGYFFFLHKQPSGEVVFSKTFDEHVKNKLKYLK